LHPLPCSGTIADKIESSSKHVEPRIKLNHSTYKVMYIKNDAMRQGGK